MKIIKGIKALFNPQSNPIIDWYWQRRYKYYKQKYIYIDPEAWFNGYNIEVAGDGMFEMGKRSKISTGSKIALAHGTRIQIGSDCMILQNVHMKTWRYSNNDYKILEYGDIKIGSYSYIGYGVVIEAGITIGKNCQIMPNSYVFRDVPDNCIYYPNHGIRQK